MVPAMDFSTGEWFCGGAAYRDREQLLHTSERLRVVDTEFRQNNWIRNQLGMDSQRIPGYTVGGAFFPKFYSDEESLTISTILNSNNGCGKCTIYGERSKHREVMYLPDGALPCRLEGSNSTAPDDSRFAYEGAQVPVSFSHNGKREDDLFLLSFTHAHDRVMSQLDTLDLKLSPTEFVDGSGRLKRDAIISSGITNPGSGRAYSLVLCLENVRVCYPLDCVVRCKIIVAVKCTPMIRRNKRNVVVSMTDYISSRSDGIREPIQIDLSNMNSGFLITIIPNEVSGDKTRVRCTGHPVIPEGFDWFNDPALAPVKLTHGADSDDDKRTRMEEILSTFKSDLSRTNQWLNISNDIISQHLSRRCGGKPVRHVEVTKFGVEFKDVEVLLKRKNSTLLSSKIYDIGIKAIALATNKSKETVEEWWKTFFDKYCGPSIVHSEEIRSTSKVFDNTALLNDELLMIRLVMSRLYTVGNGDRLEIGEVPKCAHSFNQKKIEKTLIPLSVLRDGIAVYSLNIASLKLIIDIYGNNVKEDVLKRLISKSTVGSGRDKMGVLQDDSRSLLFFVKSRLLRVAPTRGEKPSRLWLVSPSGMEYDVRPIIADICSKLRFRNVPGGESVIIWHPLFCLIVSCGKKENSVLEFSAVILPAKRKSTIVPSFHNNKRRKDFLAMDGSLDLPVHAAAVRSDLGYFEALLSYAREK
jgi:hypothetical protein